MEVLRMDEFMKAAIEEARKGSIEGGIPIGSALVIGGRIVGRGHNKRVQDGDPTAHAEIDCLRNAGRVGSYAGATLYSTLMHGVEVIDLDLEECKKLMKEFIAANPRLWNEDIGEL
jgi:creatinine deaminase